MKISEAINSLAEVARVYGDCELFASVSGLSMEFRVIDLAHVNSGEPGDSRDLPSWLPSRAVLRLAMLD